jgi:hypothetical protein
MPQYIIDLDDATDKELRSQYPQPENLFKKVIADAVHDSREQVAKAAMPVVEPVDDTKIAVSSDVKLDAQPQLMPAEQVAP